MSPAHQPCPLTLVVLLLQPAAGQLQGQGGIGPLVFSLQAQGQRWPSFLQGFQRWTQVEGTLPRSQELFLMSSALPSFPPNQNPPSSAPRTKMCPGWTSSWPSLNRGAN